mmetsp:Transcript_76366/g.236481  ORF Transcript_76366/g.236481 Transcript_76366/m.236481 type:complete len:227 (+) Transcript_76366:113-793(+)
MASAEMQEMASDPECGSEAQEEALLGGQRATRSRTFLLRMGPALAILLVATMALWSASSRPRTMANLSSLGQMSEKVGLPNMCYVDGPTGDLVEYSTSAVPDGVCARYTYNGKTAHVAVANSTCTTMMTMPSVYKDLTCCIEDLCNNKPAGMKPVHSPPSVCYTTQAAGIDRQQIPAVPTARCANYTESGTTHRMAADTILCEMMKNAPGIYQDVMCCDTDLCNGD